MVTNKQKCNMARLQHEAASWIARLRSDAVSPADKSRFSKWLNKSDDHLRAFDEMLVVWEKTAAFAHLPVEQPTRQEMGGFRGIANWFNWQNGLVAGCLLCITTLVFTLFIETPVIALPQHYNTVAGEQRRIELKDGSVIELNTKSAVKVVYTAALRRLTLSKGEAYFEVQPDKNRPFVVDVDQGTVTAVGTAFNIYRKPLETVITVTEGTVKVSEKVDETTPNPQIKRLQVKQQIHFDKHGLKHAKATDVHKATAWREKTLIFDNIELPVAIAELNRYLKQPVIYANESSLEKLHVSGTFSIDTPEATLQALISSFNLIAVQPSPQSPLYLRFK